MANREEGFFADRGRRPLSASGFSARSAGVDAERDGPRFRGNHSASKRSIGRAAGLLAGQVRGDQPRVQGLPRSRRLREEGLLEATLRPGGPRDVLGRGDSATARFDRAPRPRDVVSGKLSGGPSGLPGQRSLLVRGRGLRGVRRQAAAYDPRSATPTWPAT